MRNAFRAALVVLAACASPDASVPDFDVGRSEPRVAGRLETLRDMVRTHPDSAGAWGRLALSLHAHGYPEPAVAAYEAARELDPDRFAYVYLPAVLLAERQERRAGRLFTVARTLRREYAPLFIREARWHLEGGRFEQATSLLADSPAEPAFPAHVAFLRGRAALADQDTTEARRQLERAVELAPGFGNAHVQLAELYRRNGDAGAAELARDRSRLFGEAPPIDDPVLGRVAEEGVSSRWFILRGQSHLSAGRADRAVEELEQAVSIRPDDAHPVHLLGLAFESAGRLEEAADMYRRALTLRPDLIDASTKLARVELRLGDEQGARERLANVLAADSAVAEAYLLLGMVEQGRGRQASAARMFEESLGRAPFDPRIAIRLAWIRATSERASLRDGRQAVELARRVAALDRFMDPTNLDVLAAARAEIGDFEQAVAAARRGAAIARRRGDHGLAATLDERVLLYERGRPYRS